MLSINSLVTAGEIDSITHLSHNHPVYLLEGHREDEVVVKRENHRNATELFHNTRVMGAADRKAKANPMTVNEIQQMMSWAIQAKAQAGQATSAILHEFLAQTKAPGSWVKMNRYDLLDLHHANQLMQSQKDKSEVRELARALNAPGGMEMLGKIVAADLFNANADRFGISYPLNESNHEGSGYRDETGLRRLNHLMNWGNVMIIRGRQASPIGLDSFDPYGKFSNWSISLAAAEQAAGAQWPGRYLAPAQAIMRHKVAMRCVADLNVMLGQRNRRFASFSQVRLNRDAVTHMAAGMTRGIEQIRMMLISKYRGLAPIGLKDRAAIMGFNL
jgi:hypothetical protein